MVFGQRRREPRLLDRRQQTRGIDDGRHEANVRPLGSQVHHGFDAGKLVELLFDSQRARGTGHTAYGQVDRLRYVARKIDWLHSCAASPTCKDTGWRMIRTERLGFL